MRGNEYAERIEFERHVAFARETIIVFREELEQDESNSVLIRSCLTEHVKYRVMTKTSAKKI